MLNCHVTVISWVCTQVGMHVHGYQIAGVDSKYFTVENYAIHRIQKFSEIQELGVKGVNGTS